MHTSLRASHPDAVSRAMARNRLAPLIGWGAILATLALVAVFVWQAGLFNALMPRAPATPETIDNPEQGAATSANVTGFDKDNQPYTFSSKTALQDKVLPNKVHLTDVSGTFKRNSGEVVTLVANGGLYDTDIRTSRSRRRGTHRLGGPLHGRDGERPCRHDVEENDLRFPRFRDLWIGHDPRQPP